MTLYENSGCCPHESFVTHADGSRECLDCNEVEEAESPLDEPLEMDADLAEYWARKSELFETPDCYEIGHVPEEVE